MLKVVRMMFESHLTTRGFVINSYEVINRREIAFITNRGKRTLFLDANFKIKETG